VRTVARRLTSAMLRQLLGDEEATTVCRRTRRPRERERRPRLLPEEGEWGGWSGAGDGELWPMDDCVDFLRD
jgi:hypothetical protein